MLIAWIRWLLAWTWSRFVLHRHRRLYRVSFAVLIIFELYAIICLTYACLVGVTLLLLETLPVSVEFRAALQSRLWDLPLAATIAFSSAIVLTLLLEGGRLLVDAVSWRRP